ncbi:uncharacterized protein EDB91DRAFT_1255168 [Suillus paluster]|uniref:uncharacterized protein n=1 Tax=Suillus paluster TaxID=48578 RepID=UPI001B86A2E0|nr:uncharacterized protein EDB91DRAFT_1255168 [Suillus paluster]KAG1724573.1 hypothetical protein EDB91DRAFT_1255168 [Suillus paluster]
MKTEPAKVTVFSTLLSAGSIADTWCNKLSASDKNTWADVKTAFMTRWPAITVAEKTGLDYQHEILALCLVEEELRVQVTIADVPTWSHLQFHASLQQLINEAGTATTAGLIYQVHENLPTIMKELTTPGLTDWKKFLEEIKDIDMNKLHKKAQASRMKKEVEKAQNAQLTWLENSQAEAVEIMCLQLQHANVGPMQNEHPIINNSTSMPFNNAMARIRYITREPPQNARQPFHQCQPLTPEEQDMM